MEGTDITDSTIAECLSCPIKDGSSMGAVVEAEGLKFFLGSFLDMMHMRTDRRSIDGSISNSIFGSSETEADVSREALQLIIKLPGMNSNGLKVKMGLARGFGIGHFLQVCKVRTRLSSP